MSEDRHCELCDGEGHQNEDELAYVDGKYFCVNTRKRVWSESEEDDDKWVGLIPEQTKALEDETIEPAETKKVVREVITKWRIVKLAEAAPPTTGEGK